MNILTDATQRGYKIKNELSTSFIIRKEIPRRKIAGGRGGGDLLDLSKAFGRADRAELCEILYGEGFPTSFGEILKLDIKQSPN